MTRMAGLRALGNILKEAVVPAGNTASERLTNGAVMWGGDLLFAGLSGLAAPGGSGFNPAVALEDLGISAAGTIGSGVLTRMAGRRLMPNNPQGQDRLQMFGDIALTAPLQMFAPRPMLQAAIEQDVKGQKAQQQALQEAGDRETQEQLIQALLTSGALAMPQTYSPASLLV